MEWILPLLLGLMCLVEYPTVLAQGLSVQVEESRSVTVTCPSANRVFITRVWFQGYFVNGGASPESKTILFNQKPPKSTGEVTRVKAREDFSLDSDSFALTIGRAQLQDNGNLTCRVHDNATLNNMFNQTAVNVYIQPNITLEGMEKPFYTENETVTVTCTIDRLYPQIPPEAFQLRWGEGETVPGAQAVGTQNIDMSFRYTVRFTKTLTKEDHGKKVICKVIPIRGSANTTEKILNVRYLSDGIPKLSVDNANPFLEGRVTFTCGTGIIQGNPAVNLVNWFKDGHRMDLASWQNNFEHTTKVTLNDSGIYKCVVGNTVRFSPFSNTVQLNVSSKVDPSPTTERPSWVPAVAGAAAGAAFLILVIGIVIFCRRKRTKDDQESSTAALSNGQTLDRVVVPPEDYGDVQYSDIPPARTKPIPAQRSFRKKPEPIYDVANINNEKTLYANVNGAHLPDQANPPKKPKRAPEVGNNNTQNPEGVVYAELDLDKRRRIQKEPQGVMPNREEPTEYARIDFTKSARQ